MIARSSLQLSSFQVFDGIGSSTSEVSVEQGSGFMGRRKRRSMAAAVSGHVGTGHEQVLMRHLLAFKDGSKHKESDELKGSQQDSLNQLRWSQTVSILTILGVMVVITLAMLSVILWFRHRQESSHPC